MGCTQLMSTNKKTRIVVIGDMHCGSVFGLAPPSAIPQDKKNAFLKWDYDRWCEFCQKYENPDYLLLIGDLADGSQVMTLGVDALSTDTDEQVIMAETLIRMIIGKNTKVYGVNGSGYHGGERQATCIDRRIVERLNGEYKGNIFEFDIGNERIQMTHGGAGQSLVNPTSYILREIKLSKEDSSNNKSKAPTILLRGHQHRMFHIEDDGNVIGILNGCWQFRTPFMAKKSGNITPSIGAYIIDIEDGIAKVYREKYTIPQDVRESMNGYERLSQRKNKEKNKSDWEKLQKSKGGEKEQ